MFDFFKEGICKILKDLGVGWVGDVFVDKKAVMIIEGGWMILFLNDRKILKDLYGIVEFFVGLVGKLIMVFIVVYVMSKNLKYKFEVFKFIRFLIGEGG